MMLWVLGSSEVLASEFMRILDASLVDIFCGEAHLILVVVMGWNVLILMYLPPRICWFYRMGIIRIYLEI